ncbi:hypothetical protein ACS0TY_007981 [Phlomoides rotata]
MCRSMNNCHFPNHFIPSYKESGYTISKHFNNVLNTLLKLSTYHIDALPKVWDAYVKVDHTARGMKNKTFSFYQDWIDIFGNDRANGNES